MIRFLGRIGTGILVSIPIVCLLTGGVTSGLGFLAASIVCTAGISLVAWIPVWWFAGWLTLTVVDGIRNSSQTSQEKEASISPPTPGPGREDQALTAYIGQALASGMSVDEMEELLQSNGWGTAEIRPALRSILSSKAKAKYT